MGGKHKKFLRSEKSKVKLKDSKLPKGLNVTKTSFNIKSIVIKEQLQNIQLEDKKEKLITKDVIEKLKHHNKSFRTDALKYIKSCISPNFEIQYLGSLIQATTNLCLDIEREVRQESFVVLASILSIMKSETIQPFFNVISSYLKCAMTHIEPKIQQDSLLMLDILLTYLPKLITNNSDDIFSNFLNMISKHRCDSISGRTLTTPINSQVAIIKWRCEVLERLERMLKILFFHKKDSMNISTNLIKWSKRNTGLLEHSQIPSREFLHSEKVFVPLLRHTLNNEYNVSSLFNKNVIDSKSTTKVDRALFKTYVEQLMPLLFESWLEIRPMTRNKEKYQNILTAHVALTLKLILNIMLILYELAELYDIEVDSNDLLSWFDLTYNEDFNLCILSQFPYQQGEGLKDLKTKPKSKNEKKTYKSEEHCFQQNLLIILHFCIFNGMPSKQAFKINETKEILNYLTNIMANLNEFHDDNLILLTKVLRYVLYRNGKTFLQINAKGTRFLLNTIMETYETTKYLKPIEVKIFTLFFDIVLDIELSELYRQNDLISWLIRTAEALHKDSIPKNTLLILSSLSKRNHIGVM